MTNLIIRNLSNNDAKIIRAKKCDTFWSRFLGLMFRPTLVEDEGILLVETSESRLNTAIHMLFMRFDLAIIWIDRQNQIVDTCYAKKWMPAYLPKAPAMYILEIHPARLKEYASGNWIEILYETE